MDGPRARPAPAPRRAGPGHRRVRTGHPRRRHRCPAVRGVGGQHRSHRRPARPPHGPRGAEGGMSAGGAPSGTARARRGRGALPPRGCVRPGHGRARPAVPGRLRVAGARDPGRCGPPQSGAPRAPDPAGGEGGGRVVRATGQVDQGAAARAAGLDPARLDLEVAPAAGDGLVTVRAAYRQPLAVPLVGVVHRDVTLTAQLSIRAEEAQDAGAVLTLTDSGLDAALQRPASPVWVDVPS